MCEDITVDGLASIAELIDKPVEYVYEVWLGEKQDVFVEKAILEVSECCILPESIVKLLSPPGFVCLGCGYVHPSNIIY